jgi:hypothetical protein
VRPHRSSSDEEAQRPPAESEVLHGNQLRCHKQFSSCLPFVRLSIGFISLCFSLIFSNQTAKSQRNRIILWPFTWLLTDNL